ncbi:MAG: asparagine synthase (glutamine-hydrolyzing) [Bacteroidetes bacterium]|nr:MAG: asparagine synthase (glutamine-hydrolyzing) [Bacteroidota bacterium]
MCGIAVILSLEQEQRDRFAFQALKMMNHRGPDSNGTWSDELEVCLGHNRLAILDLSDAGHQPMISSCGQYIMVFNGEIYNHQELRQKYLPNYEFKSTTDTETILELYKILGSEMQTEMLGMWAFAIWDIQKNELFVSRDRYGQKPLYFVQTDTEIAFASEIEPLLVLLDRVNGDTTMISEYLSSGNYGHLREKTFFSEIEQIKPGHFAIVSGSQRSIESNSYWRLPVLSEKKGIKATQKYLDELKEIIKQAVLSQTLADVPIGVTLSGGIDSSVITGILAKYYPEKFSVFTAQTAGSKYDETSYVDAVLNRLGKEKYSLHKIDLNNLMSQEDLDDLLDIQEEPFGDPSIMAHHQLMKLAKETNTKVILGGQGADEIFLGYGHSVNVILAHCIRCFKFKTILDWMINGQLGKNMWARILLAALFPRLEVYLRSKSRNKRKSQVSGYLNNTPNDVKLFPLIDVNQSWEDSIYGVHIPHLVHYDDRNGMSVSTEGRMPFLDHRIIEKLGELKPSEFVKGAKRKSILRLACEEYLPKEVLNRRDKIGFYTPLQAILKSWSLNGNSNNEKELSKYMENPTIISAMNTFRLISYKRWASRYRIKNE